MAEKLSVISGQSRGSRHSGASKAEAEAEMAALKVKMKYLEVESVKRLELEKLETQRSLEMAEARFTVFKTDEENTLLYGKDIICDEGLHKPQTVTEYVQEYIDKNPLIVEGSVHSEGNKDKTEQPEIHKEIEPSVKQPERNERKLDIAAPEFVPHAKTDSVPGHYAVDFANMTKSFAEQINIGRLPTPEPGVFSGDPLRYPAWKGAFETLIERRGIPPSERIYYLKRYLSGAAKECVEGFLFLNSDVAYDKAKALLDKRFGNNFIIANAFRDKLDSWPKVEGKDGPALRRLADYLGQCLIAMRTIDSLNVWNDERENKRILGKLPDWLTYRWARYVASWREEKGSFPSFSKFVSFVTKEAEIVCDPVTSRSTTTLKRPEVQHRTFNKQSNFSTETAILRDICAICGKGHLTESCKDFLAKPLYERKIILRDKYLCFGCLGSGHISRNCTKRSKCKVCARNHPTALHGDRVTKKDTTNTEATAKTDNVESKSTVVHMSEHVAGGGDKCSMIIPVWLSHKNNPENRHLVYALLDTQSDTTFVLNSTCDKLKVDGPPVKLMLSTMTSENQPIESCKISGLSVQGLDEKTQISLPDTYSREIMPANKDHIPTPDKVKGWTHLEHLASELVPLQDAEIGLLIGYNCPRALAPRDIIPPVMNNGPYGQRTDLGWGVVGIVDHGQVVTDALGVSHRVSCHEVPRDHCMPATNGRNKFQISCRTRVKELVSPQHVIRVLELDFSDHKTDDVPMSLEDKTFLSKMETDIHQRKDKHYEMPLPFHVTEPDLPNNKPMAMQRLMHLKRRFLKDEQYAKDYSSFMENIIKSGYAEKVPLYDVNNVWYIPHHGIYHPKKPGKIRVVFDCSAQFGGVSLNDFLLKGPELTNTLLGVLCRFRKETIAIQCDIEQMFYQFSVNECHRDYLRFLWWESSDWTRAPVDYRMTVHLFGATSSPGCANYGLKQVAKDFEVKYGSEAARFVREDFYVDDGLTSVATVEEAVDLVKQSRAMCKEGGLRLHKFVSNSKEVISAIPAEDCASGVSNIDLLDNVLPVERVLGVSWCIESDTFQFRITLNDKPLVRRNVLSTLNSIYDPLGLIAPVLLMGKQILQETCRGQLDWDSPLPDNLAFQWEKWRSQMFDLEGLQIPRCYKPDYFGEVKAVELHHFSDASTTGYGQASYLRIVDEMDHVHCAFVIGKARVSPLKSVTIPRLELNAAVVSVRISQFLRRELHFDNMTEYFWCDSKVVLGYISNDSRRFHTFVSNRVQQIRDHTEVSQWRYVSSSENPADAASRGIGVKNLQSSKWLEGPDFLWKGNLSFHESKLNVELSSEDPEVKRVKTLAGTTVTVPARFELQRLEHISNWQRTRKAVALCLKLKTKLVARSRSGKFRGKNYHAPVYNDIHVEDLEEAERQIVKLVQAESFEDEILALKSSAKGVNKSSHLRKLDPYLDAEGILRVGGRVGRSCLHHDLKHPRILPRRHHITLLVIQHFHERIGHQGRGMTVNQIRSNGIWIIGCGSAVSQVVSKCVKCRKMRGGVQEQKMADLPKDRMEEGPPFSYCAVDIFGPFLVKEGRKELKRYGALFTCLVSRAIHIETTNSLSSDSFINALRRFIAIRGPIRQLRCDQGTNFVGAQRELQEFKGGKVKEFLQRENCDYFPFVMNVPSASHMGGVWERQIRTARSALSALMNQHGSMLDDEGLRTLMAEVMSIVNSRPLSVDTLNDPMSLNPLTPNHLLTAKTKVILPPSPNFQRADKFSAKMWRRVQYLADDFWNRWRKEFLHTLQQRQKWLHPKRDLRIGDVVLVKDDNLCRNRWQIARVCETYPDEDQHVRKDDVTRFWREEREDGAVYSAYLKKVTYRSQAQLEDEHEREFSHLMWETLKMRVIKAGTLEKLVESLSTVRGELDSTYVNVFLATYRTFATPEQVLQMLIDRYTALKSCCEDDRTEVIDLQLKTIKSVISVWLDTHPEDFKEPPDYVCLHTLERFSLEFLPDSDLAVRARHRIERHIKEEASSDANNIEFRFSICDEVDHMIEVDYEKPLAFSDISTRTFAQQLTFKDAELFKKVVPHHCLGAVWSRRGKKGGKEAASVLATIHQFNRLSLRVIASILKTLDSKTSQRAKIVQKWIQIAQELRELKNFSSLKAIISGLQSHPVYRLRKTWSALPKETMVLFEELSEIFSGENNQLNSRELLMKEATAKFPDLDSQNKTLKRRNMQKRQSWIDNGIVQGTVPYLGTFLTDLTMIDTANPDMTEEGLINFEKHRKEFEVLAQLKLLQSAAQIYNMQEDAQFWVWFDAVRVYNDNESHEMSCAIEPPTEGSAKIKKKSARYMTPDTTFAQFLSLGHKPSKLDHSRFGLFACGVEDRSSLSSIPDTITASLAGPLMSHSSSASSVISSDSDTCSSPYKLYDTYVIRVSLEPSDQAKTHIYKSIMLCNTDHTNTVIHKVLEKYSLEGQPEEYCLLQVLPDGGELLIPDRSNVYYALNNTVDLKFVVRTRAEHESMTLKRKGKRRGNKLSL